MSLWKAQSMSSETKDKVLQIPVPASVASMIEARAREQDRSVTNYCRHVLKQSCAAMPRDRYELNETIG
jgi:hypothetical protein